MPVNKALGPSMSWVLHKRLMMGGTTNLGFSSNSRYLLAVSHSGRGIFDASSGERLARNYDAASPWHRDTEVDGIGPCEGETIPVYGIHAEIPNAIRNELNSIGQQSHITEFSGAAISLDGMYFAIGYSDEIAIYKKAQHGDELRRLRRWLSWTLSVRLRNCQRTA